MAADAQATPGYPQLSPEAPKECVMSRAISVAHNGTRAATRPDETRTVTPPVHFREINSNNVEMLRTLNTAIFPVRYSNTFYGDVLFTPKGYSKFAYWDSFVVGAICCRQEPLDPPSSSRLTRTYIMTLGVLAPYRHFNIGGALLESVIKCSIADGVDHIYLHVQTNNDAALSFYRKFGFTITDTIPNYYKRIEPPDCYVLVKQLRNASPPARAR